MAIQNITTEDSLKVWTQKTNIIAQNIGELTDLTSTDKTSIVHSANELLGIYNSSPSNVVEDLSPQLGGHLDLNSKNITGTGNINITSYQGSISSTTTATTPIQSDSSTKISTTAYVNTKIPALAAAAAFGGDVTGAPSNLQIGSNKVGVNELDGTENSGVEFLKTDGSGQLSFINTVGSTGGGDISGNITSLQLNADKVNVNELNLTDGSTGHLLTTSGSNVITFRPSVKQSKVVTTANQTVFNISYIVNNIVVYLNGLKLIKGVDFTATNGTSVTLTSPVASGLYVEFQRYGVS